MAAPTTGLTIIKRFTYRGNPNEEFSNHYWLSGSTPADATAWRTLFDALVAQEKTCLPAAPGVQVIGGYGYNSTSDTATAIWSVDLTVSPNTPVSGTLTTTGGQYLSGDTAMWVRWGLDRFNTKGKRIYLRKYFHPAMAQTGSTVDQISTAATTALTAFGAKMRDGSFADSRTIVDKLGNVPIGHAVGPYVTTRTLKRRGKRPPT